MKGLQNMTGKQSSEISIKPKILVVDDEKVVRKGCREVLSIDGFEVVLAENGEQGLKKVEEMRQPPTLLDVVLSETGSVEIWEPLPF
jgi:CheY-like chemotaxis protein